ncbi:hypothetical protein Bbelb_255980 [Branchiostoma belcheri]|nr:hypothetical protein Bbelb_255980 [Branchiostoma belcheri]
MQPAPPHGRRAHNRQLAQLEARTKYLSDNWASGGVVVRAIDCEPGDSGSIPVDSVRKRYSPRKDALRLITFFARRQHAGARKASVKTRRTCFCVLSTCKNVRNRTASVRGEYHLRTESYGFGSTQTRRTTLSACNTFSTCGLRIYHPCVRVRATRVPRTAYERATYGLRESNFTILTCNCCTDSARSMCVPRTVLASSVLTPHFPVDLLNDHAEHTCTIPVYKDNLTGGCQLVSKMPRKAQKKTTRQDPKKRAAEDTRAASDDEVNRRCTHLQRASEPRTYTLRVTYSLGRPPYVCRKNVADVATTKTYGQKARTASCDRRLRQMDRAYLLLCLNGLDVGSVDS